MQYFKIQNYPCFLIAAHTVLNATCQAPETGTGTEKLEHVPPLLFKEARAPASVLHPTELCRSVARPHVASESKGRGFRVLQSRCMHGALAWALLNQFDGGEGGGLWNDREETEGLGLIPLMVVAPQPSRNQGTCP